MNLIIHGTAHRDANGVAMPTDEDDQDDHFLFNHPERGGGLCCRLGAQSRCYPLSKARATKFHKCFSLSF